MKKLILSLVFLAIFFSGLLYILDYQKKSIESIKTSVANSITVYQSVNPDRQETANFDTINIQTGATALYLLKRSYPVKTKGEGANAFVTSINERSAEVDKKEFWAFYVNGKQAEVGAGSYKLKPGDKVLWKIETF